jgi:phosphinothricin acetyltransferase
MNNLTLRAGVASDLVAINDIYNHYVATSHCTFDIEPISMPTREAWFEQFTDSGPHRLRVASHDDRVVGFAYSSPLRPRAAYDSSVEFTLYIHPETVAAGVGSALYRDLIAVLKAAQIRLNRVYAGIALPNDASIALHTRFGFRKVGVWSEVGLKFDTYWDVAWYERSGLDD